MEKSLMFGECRLYVAADEQCIDDSAYQSESYFIVNHVTNQRSFNALSRFFAQFVAMMPTLERAFVLHVGEVVILFKLSDARDPLRANRKKREDAKRRHDGRANAGRVASCTHTVERD